MCVSGCNYSFHTFVEEHSPLISAGIVVYVQSEFSAKITANNYSHRYQSEVSAIPAG